MVRKLPVRRRQVWYVHGFDPATTRRYRRIFEAASARLGVSIEDLGDDHEGWRARRGDVVTDIRFCRYEDLVRRFQRRPLWWRFLRGAASIAAYLQSGALLRIARLGPRALGLMLSPLVVVFGCVAAVLGVSFSVLPGAVGWGVGLVAAGLIGGAAFSLLYLHLVADLFAYIRVLALGAGPDWSDYQGRITDLGCAITVAEDTDEVLLVGHSLGGIGAILVLEQLLARLPPERRVGLLTLGSVHGVVLVQTGAGRERLSQAIRSLAADRRVFWLDVTAPRDAFCLPLVDPLLLTGGDAKMQSPRVISAQLSRAPRIPGDRRTLFAAMRRHMGYLLAPQSEGGFDYADLVTGEAGLAAAFADRRDSPRARMRRSSGAE